MTDLKLYWSSDPVIPVPQDGVLALALDARLKGTVVLAPNETTIDLGSDANLVSSVSVDGQPVGFIIDGSTVRITPTAFRRTVEIECSGNITYSVIGSGCPDDVVLASDGTITGTIDPTELYEFTIRASVGPRVSDRTFTIGGDPDDFEVMPVTGTAPLELTALSPTPEPDTPDDPTPPPPTPPRAGSPIVAASSIGETSPPEEEEESTPPEVVLRPAWMTPSGGLGDFFEGDQPVITLNAIRRADVTVEAGRTSYILGSVASRVSVVKVNGSAVPFTVAQDTIVFDALSSPALMTIEADGNGISYTRLNGSLPDGMVLSAAGSISGTAQNVVENTTYLFSVRATANGKIADRSFSIVIKPVDESGTITAGLPAPVFFADLGISVVPLGSYARSTVFSRTIPVRDGDGDPAPLVLAETVLPPGAVVPPDVFFRLPTGLSLKDWTISGNILAADQPGRYLFDVAVADSGAARTTCLIQVREEIERVFQPMAPGVTWVTDAGFLGVIATAEPSLLAVEAKSTSKITYSLAPDSKRLPPGLYLDSVTGQIQGIGPWTPENAIVRFTIRAEIPGGTFTDRSFYFAVAPRFSSPKVVEIVLRPSVEERMLPATYSGIIQQKDLYRPGDPSFGLPYRAEIYLLGGVENITPLERAREGEPGEPIGTGDDFWGVFYLVLGRHMLAYARDEKGNIVYEILYRVLYDPQDRTGGFTLGDTPIPDPVIWPQSGVNPKTVNPISLRNMRADIAKDVGIAAIDPAQRNRIGLSSEEAMPLWMRSRQDINNPASVPGFVPALPVAYLLPGRGAAALAAAEAASDLPPLGKVLEFDRYIKRGPGLIKTIFDSDVTRFDLGADESIFDLQIIP